MAVSLPRYSDYPEFDPQSFRRSGTAPARPASAPRKAKRNARLSARNVERRVRSARQRQGSLIGGLLRSRLMDDLCAVVVVAAGLFFLLSLARMLLTP